MLVKLVSFRSGLVVCYPQRFGKVAHHWQGFGMWKVWSRVVFVYVALVMYSMYIRRNTLLLHGVQVGRTGVAGSRRQGGSICSSFNTNLIVNHTA